MPVYGVQIVGRLCEKWLKNIRAHRQERRRDRERQHIEPAIQRCLPVFETERHKLHRPRAFFLFPIRQSDDE
ncbi:hypothetical protein SZ28_11925 [Burkholderia pseudomallei]|nr:hypothetical protein SZ28_11925 [Burkholderia pseudomallei]